ncbi:MAG: hypothetical protein EOP84_18430 [Verrucomicrobiaceae bacterium]|nr:MAG: hypothetical protein EOP84_18430 [Verrucomicrobiaceae bacterium]
MTNADADKGRLVMEAFRYFRVHKWERMTVRMIEAYCDERGLDPRELEGGLHYTRLQGWTENGPNQSAVLTDDGHRVIH